MSSRDLSRALMRATVTGGGAPDSTVSAFINRENSVSSADFPIPGAPVTASVRLVSEVSKTQVLRRSRAAVQPMKLPSASACFSAGVMPRSAQCFTSATLTPSCGASGS